MDEEKQKVQLLAPWTWRQSEWGMAIVVWLPLYLFSFPVAAAIAGANETGWTRTAFMVAYAPLIFAIRIVADPRP